MKLFFRFNRDTWCDTVRKFLKRGATRFLFFINFLAGTQLAPSPNAENSQRGKTWGDKMKLEKTLQQCVSFAIAVTVIFMFASVVKTQEIVPTPNCERTIKADVVAFDQPFFYNRLGAVNPAGMNANNNIVHTDLNAIITGPGRGNFPSGTYRPNPVEPDRNQPFREFTVVYHDEIQAVQAFPQFDDEINGQPNPLAFTLHSVRDGFAINYGTGGIGAEILANRFGVGPMHKCTECLFEEFFLSAWTVGDPAQIVDKPANTTDSTGQLITGQRRLKFSFRTILQTFTTRI